MIDLSLLPDGGVGWLDASGESPDIVISTRVRLARNLEGYAFSGRARDGERLRVLSQVREAMSRHSRARAGRAAFASTSCRPEDRLLLHERHLVSRELAGLDPQRPVRSGAAVYLTRGTSVMVNEEDHLRLQCAASQDSSIADAFSVVEALDADLGERVPYAYHKEFGFLTACPTNVGTGLRASVLIHLPGLVLTKEIAKVWRAFSRWVSRIAVFMAKAAKSSEISSRSRTRRRSEGPKASYWITLCAWLLM